MSIGKFVEEAMKDLLLRAQELSNGKAIPPVNSSVGGGAATRVTRPQYKVGVLEDVKLKGKKSSQDKKNLFNQDPCKSVQLDMFLGHFLEKIEMMMGKLCAYCCKKRGSIQCSICGVVLCYDDICFSKWHKCINLV